MNELYQLHSTTQKLGGGYFLVDGPHDKHGFVIRSTKIVEGKHKGKYLNLVRGTGKDVVPKNRVNDYIHNGFKISPKSEEKKYQKSIKGNKFKDLKEITDASTNGEIALYNKLPGHRGWSPYKIITNTDTEVSIQRIGSYSHNPIFVISK